MNAVVNVYENKKGMINMMILFLVILLGAYLRVWELGSESLRLDEAQSVWQASHSLDFIKNYMLRNVHLPLHNTLLHVWMKIFGTSAEAVRVLAIIPGILAVPAIYYLSMEILNNQKRALFATFLAAVSPFWIWYSREIRMYTLLIFVTILSYLFFIKLLKTGKTRFAIFYLLSNIIGVYTHYFFNLVLIVQALFFFIAWRKKWTDVLAKRGWSVFLKLIFVSILTLGAFSPWLYNLISTLGAGSYAPELQRPSPFNIILSYFEFTLGYQPEPVTAALIALWPMLVLIGFVFLSKRSNPMLPFVWLAILGTLLPVIVVFSISILYKPIFLTRYLIIVTPLYLITLTWIFMEMKGTVKGFLIAVFIGTLLAALYHQYTGHDIPARENYRDAVTFINQNVNPRDIVIVSPPYTLFPLQYYYNGPARVSTMPIWDNRYTNLPEVSPEILERDATFLQQGHKRIFLLTTLDLDGGFAARHHFEMNYTKLDKRQFSKFVWVEVYQAEYLPEPQD